MKKHFSLKKLVHLFLFTAAILGVLNISAISGVLIAWFFGIWDMPFAGFFTAFNVVLVSHFTAPSRSPYYRLGVFLVGAIAAFDFLYNNASFPEDYGALAYQTTNIPFYITVLGGVVGLLVVYILMKIKSPNDTIRP